MTQLEIFMYMEIFIKEAYVRAIDECVPDINHKQI